MDAEHRHELKQNDFVVYAKRAPHYLKTHWWEAICAVLIIYGVTLGLHKFFGSNQNVRPNMDKQAKVTAIYQDIATAKGDAISGEADIDKTQEMVSDLLEKGGKLDGAQNAMTKIKAADAIRAQLHYSNTMPDKETVDAHVSEAVSLYEKAMEEADGNVNIEAMSQFGIALAKEDAGNFDEAATIYGQIIANTAYDKTCFVELAKDKLDAISMARQQFAFVEPKPAAIVEEGAAAPVVEEKAVN